jgi:hypothetical protein
MTQMVVKYSGETKCPKILADLAPLEASRVRLKGTGPNAAAETSVGWSRYLSKYGYEEATPALPTLPRRELPAAVEIPAHSVRRKRRGILQARASAKVSPQP